MKSTFILLRHSLKRVRVLVLVMGVLLGGFQLVLILVAGSIQKSNSFDQVGSLIPDFMRNLMGPSFVGLMSFSGIVCVGYFHIAVMGALVGLTIAVATEPASEIETLFMDLILSRPIARHCVITRSVLLLMICAAFVLAMMMLGTWSGLYFLAPSDADWPTSTLICSLALNLGMLMLCWGGIALALTSGARRRSVAGSFAGLLALTTYLLDYVARVWEPAEKIALLSPFRYYNPLDMIMGREVSTHNLLVLAGIAGCGVAVAYVLFSKRDV
jgi:beta-exotoxin I transport system permease protein